MRILTRYLLRAHTGPFLFSLSVLTGLLLINTVARRFEQLAGKGLPISAIVEVFILSIPYTLALTFPMSVLVAVLYVFSQFTADNEITALKASGVSLIRLLTPLIVAGAVLTAGMIYFNDRILPEANHRLAMLLLDIGRKSPTLELREQVINEVRTGDQRMRLYLQAAKIEPITNRLIDVVIYDLSTPDRDRTIYADSGRMAFDADRTDLFLTLYDGWVHERDRDEPDQFRRMFYGAQVIRMEGVGDQFVRDSANSYRGDREMSVSMLRDEVRDRQAELERLHSRARQYSMLGVQRALRGPGDDGRIEPDAGTIAVGLDAGESARATGPAPSSGLVVDLPKDISKRGPDMLVQHLATELTTLETRIEATRRGINRYSVELHKKYAIPFACIVFVLIGAPLAVRFPRGGVGMVIAFSLVIFSIYWMGLTGGEQLGDRGYVSPLWGMWAVNVVFLALGVWALARIGREVSTSRGGGWDDVFYAIRGVIGRRLAFLTRGSQG